MHVDGPGATQKFEGKARVVEERWLTKIESRKKSHSGKSLLETGGKISDEPCDGLSTHRKKTPWSRGVDEAGWDQPDGEESGGRKAWG